MYGTHATHSMRCGSMHQHLQHLVCTVHMPHTQDELWVDAPTPTAHDMYGTHATHTAWAVGRCTNTHSTWYVWYTCHTHTACVVGRCTNTHSTWYVWHTCHIHSMGCGSMHQHPQHIVCTVHIPHTQHGLWVDAPTPTAHVMYGPHATHTAWAVG